MAMARLAFGHHLSAGPTGGGLDQTPLGIASDDGQRRHRLVGVLRRGTEEGGALGTETRRR